MSAARALSVKTREDRGWSQTRSVTVVDGVDAAPRLMPQYRKVKDPDKKMVRFTLPQARLPGTVYRIP